MKRILKVSSVLLCIALIITCFAGCKGNGDNGGNRGNGTGYDHEIPTDLLTEEEYRSEVKKLLEGESFVTADTDAIDKLGDSLKDMIVYSTNDITDTPGTTYYISNNGDDNNDGKTPETAWATLAKAGVMPLEEGDLILFERGGLWRGTLTAQTGVTYSAYGKGPKPKIYTSIDGMQGEWTETDKKDVYIYSEKIYKSDVCVIVFDGVDANAKIAQRKNDVNKISRDLDFAFQGMMATSGKKDNRLYLKCKEGNPKDVFESMEISIADNTIELSGKDNITLNNLDLKFGKLPFQAENANNLTTSYCIAGWHGGNVTSSGIRFLGGIYSQSDGDGFKTDHCYVYQQFDSGVTAQVAWSTIKAGKGPSVYEDFITTDCLFEYCEYTLEYFSTQTDTNENCFKNMYFGYNFCRYGGYGFGDKAGQSAYVKSWMHENNCYDSAIEYNVFDRPVASSINIASYAQKNSSDDWTASWGTMPAVKNNIFIHRKDRDFGKIMGVVYKFNSEEVKKIHNLGLNAGSRYLYAPENNK